MAESSGSAGVWSRRGYCVFTSGFFIKLGGGQTDLTLSPLYLSSASDDAKIGQALRTVLKVSRYGVIPSYKMGGQKENLIEFDNKLANLFQLKNSRNLYPKMKHVLVRWVQGQVTLSPMRHRRGGVFEGFSDLWPDKADVIVPFEVSDDELGAAVREALRRSV